MLFNSGILAATAVLAAGHGASQAFSLTTLKGLVADGVLLDVATYKGRKAVRVREDPVVQAKSSSEIALLAGTDFANGTIEIDVAGLPAPGADAGARGFVGIAFRAQDEGKRFECFYLRPTNGRADDQLRRNHSTQYISPPVYTWQKLRTEHPGVYESYADMEPGVWTHMRVVVKGGRARLYVGNATQPSLIVNDLKLGASAHGPIALWIGIGTEAYFSNLKITRE